ncbi:MAG: DUF4136 domain-containing protein [Deltaproteobacteria bacterium]|nr:DUF4136 domain-containing protein [Deltaproteobacteria bacterium]
MSRWLVLGWLACTACTAVNVRTDHNPDVNFAGFKTYAMSPGSVVGLNGLPPGPREQQVMGAIEAAIQQTLPQRGLTENRDAPDVLVTYVAGARQRTELEAAPPPVYATWGVSPWDTSAWWGPAYQTFWSTTYTEGTLVIDVSDAHTHQIIWRAYLTTPIGNRVDPKLILTAVQKAFDRYPPH